jgi:magnesium-transporting ATPase (P-type)
VCFDDDHGKLGTNLKNGNQDLISVLLFLGVCHTIIVDAKKGTYNAASPDELALVNAAK